MDKLLTIKQTAETLGVATKTLRDWDSKDFFKSVRTKGNHRRYRESDVLKFIGNQKLDTLSDLSKSVCIYGRVSSHDQKQKGDLDRQCQRLSEYCAKKKYIVEYILKDIGSGLSDSRRGVLRLFNLVTEKKISKVVIEHKDRLTRFQYNFFEYFFDSYNVEIEIVEGKKGEGNDELVEDIMMLMASFSGKIHGRRSAKRRKKKKSEERGMEEIARQADEAGNHI